MQMEPGPDDPVAEWAAAGGETGLEEPMWQLGLGSGPESYPERPDEPDCIYYLRTGYCGYGSKCRFNHPQDRGLAMGALRSLGGEYPERVGQPVCQHYMRTGMCKYGVSCKYHHPKQVAGSSAVVVLNYYGYPLRPGEKECSYYIKTGQCKFGVTCRFHHPQPAGAQAPPPALEPGPTPAPGPTPMPTPLDYPTMQSPLVPSSQQYGLVQGTWPVARPPMLPGSYVPGSYGPMLIPTGVVPVPGWAPYPEYMLQAPVSPTPIAQPTVGSAPLYEITTQFSPSGTAYSGPYLSVTSSSHAPSGSIQRENPFPERPGQPECQYYFRTGDCKFGSTCKYHHPPEWSGSKSSVVLTLMGLPLRPGAPLCSHYAQNGVCKFGPSCKYDHPMRVFSYSPSTSSLTDMPVAPYPVRSTRATLAPSSSSSDLRPELLSGASADIVPSQMTSLSASVGSIVSSSGTVAQSSAQQPGIVSSAGSDQFQTAG